MKLKLPWPPKVLNPNSRAHWRAKAGIAAAYKLDCFLIAKIHGLKAPAGKAVLALTFCPPDKRHRDDDNLIAAFKSGRDGIAEAVGVNDRNFVLQVEIGEPVKGGAVLVEIFKKGEA